MLRAVGRILEGHLNGTERVSLLAPEPLRSAELEAIAAGELLLGVWGDDPDILTMRTIENSTRLQNRVGEADRVSSWGAAFIGCEAAASLPLRGAGVTLISLEESPQRERLGPEGGDRIESWLMNYGMDLRLGARIERTGSGYTVSLQDGNTVDTGTVLFGTGVAPRRARIRKAGRRRGGRGKRNDHVSATNDPTPHVGIDVSKDRLDVCLLPSGEAFCVSNDPEGIEALVERLLQREPELVVLEATGRYERPAATAIAATGMAVAVVNPSQARDFAKATGRLA